MCTENQLDTILSSVKDLADEKFGNKLDKVILYGSYARGDYDNESDIDIIVIARVDAIELRGFNRAFCELASELGLRYDIMVSVMLKDSETFNKYCDVLPFYKNVLKEGIDVA